MSRAPESNFFFSGDLTTLARKYCERIAEENRRKRDPLLVRKVIVPNRNVSRWLEMRIADWTGICGNFEFLYLEPGLRGKIRELTGQTGNLAARDDVTLAILKALLAGEGTGRLKEYAQQCTSAALYHFAARLASLFQEYEYHRFEWTEAWSEGIFSGPEAFEEQGRLYFNVKRQLTERGLSNLADYARTLEGAAVPSSAGSNLVLFGVSQISRLHVKILFHLSEFVPLDYYMLDFISHSGSGWTALDAPIPEPEGPVRSWLGVQAAQIRELRESRKASHHWMGARVLPEGGSSLARTQRLILGAEPGASEEDSPSLEVIGCPGIYREAETIYLDIVERMRQDPGLTLTDIAVLVPDMPRYRPALESVFERDTDMHGRPRIPFSITDFQSGDASVYAAGLESLLDLMDGEFRRSQVFAVLRNPCFQQAHGLSEKTVADWSSLIDRLAVHHGWNPEDPYSFLAGLRRYRLGFVMQMEDGDYQGVVPFQDPFAEERDAGILSMTLSGLAADIEQLRVSQTFELPRVLRDLTEKNLAIPAGFPHERRIQSSVDSTLARLARLRVELPADLLREIVLASAQGLSASRGDYLAGGVTISALQPMRPIPFRVVYIAGMEEGSFPGKADESTLNLRNLSPMPTDVSLPDANRLLFLEASLSAREHLIITYNCKDIQKDAEFKPCSTVQEFLELAESAGISVSRRVVAIHASSESGFVAPPESMIAVLESVSAGAALSQGQKDFVAEQISRRRHSPRPAPSRIRRVNVLDLARYLEDPAGCVLADLCGLKDDDRADVTLDDCEPVYIQTWQYPRIWREMISEYFRTGARPEETLDRIYAAEERVLRVPRGAFGEVQRHDLLGKIKPDLWAVPTGGPWTPTVLEGFEMDGAAISGECEFTRESGMEFEILFPSHSKAKRKLLYPYVLYLCRTVWLKKQSALRLMVPAASDRKVDAWLDMRFPLLDPDRAARILRSLLEGYTTGDMEFVPLELIDEAGLPEFEDDGGDPDERYMELLTALVDDPDKGPFTWSKLAALSDPVITKRAASLAEIRLGHFLGSKP